MQPCWIVPLLLLHPQYYLTSIWTITGFQYQPVIFFGLLGVYLLSKNTFWTFLGAAFAVFFDSFTMSNGLFYWIVGMVILALQARYKMLGIWLIFTIATFKLYFYKFDTQANDQGFDYFFHHPHESFFGFFTHLGGSFDFQTLSPILERSIVPTIAGFILILIAIWWIFLKGMTLLENFSIAKYGIKLQNKLNAEPSNYIILGCFLFLVINAIVIAILRPRFGYFVMLVSNYKIYPATMLVIAYLMILTGWLKFNLSQKSFKWILIGSVAFYVASYLKFLPEVHERRKDLLVRIFNQEHDQIGLGPIEGSDFDRYVQTALARLVPKGIFQYPQTIFKDSEKEILNQLPDNQSTQVDIRMKDKEVFVVSNEFPIGFGINDGIYLLLKSAKKTYLIYQRRNTLGYFNNEIAIQIPPQYLVRDAYQIGIFWVNGDTQKVFNANQTIEVNF